MDIYRMAQWLRKRGPEIRQYAASRGCDYIQDESGSMIDCQIIDAAKLDFERIHPQMSLDREFVEQEQPVILVMDYAFGEQAFEVMDELFKPYKGWHLNVKSISIMGKAGILEGSQGDIMLPTAHVFEGVTDTYLCQNELAKEDFDDSAAVYRGSIVTVLGTSLQNRYVLTYFLKSSWKAIGLEMEGGHYQKAIQSAILRGHISADVRLRYAYYASDNPLHSGQTLASGGMGEEGIKPAYMISNVLLRKILNR
jgi:hypothetical protein